MYIYTLTQIPVYGPGPTCTASDISSNLGKS